MFCSACGSELAAGQAVCPRCGRPLAPPAPPVPGFQFELQSYAGKLRALSVVWFIYAGLSLVFGIFGLAFADAMFAGRFGPWWNGPWGRHGLPPFFGPAFLHFIWVIVAGRAVLALAAGYGLMERAQWGRIVAIVAAFVSILKFPFGTALAIWTLVTLLGYRNTTLYDQIAHS